ncbi:MAG: ABC-three component system protein [Flavobacteriales bacterium]
MDKLKQAWYGLKIDEALQKKREQEYEDFFCAIMEAIHADDFQKIKPAGSLGDGKADGYLQSSKIVFQSYAPDTGFQKPKLLAKIKDNLPGAISQWGDRMDKWVLVHHDKEGLPKYALDKIAEFSQQHPQLEFTSWSPNIIRSKALNLSENKLIEIFGYAPSFDDINNLTHEPIKDLLKAIGESTAPIPVSFDPVSVLKLEFNSLSTDAENLLIAGRRKEYLVGDLLSKWHDPSFGEDTSQAFKARYTELKELQMTPNEVFAELHKFAGGTVSNTALQASSLAVLSYFFERCDIFENPPAGWTR